MLNDYSIVQRFAENMHTLPTVKRFKRNLRVLTTILIITSPGRLSKLKLEVSEILPGIACLKPFQDKIDPPTDKMLFINWWVYLWQKTKKMIECTPLAKVQQFEGRGVHFYQGGVQSFNIIRQICAPLRLIQSMLFRIMRLSKPGRPGFAVCSGGKVLDMFPILIGYLKFIDANQCSSGILHNLYKQALIRGC